MFMNLIINVGIVKVMDIVDWKKFVFDINVLG